ncbi:MAG: hypothetical protein IJ306_04480, partial [Oscillospiraceae bacterium]|nr:hypothetical protein [Oscillospiraceae bacterium]
MTIKNLQLKIKFTQNNFKNRHSTVGNGLDRSFPRSILKPSPRAKTAKRALWAIQRAGFGAG